MVGSSRHTQGKLTSLDRGSCVQDYFTDVLCILTVLDLCNFQQYYIVLQWIRESSRRGDVTAKAAAEW